MVDLCLQVQPGRGPALDMTAVSRIYAKIGEARFVERYSEYGGDDDGPCVNFMFATSSPVLLWRELRSRLFDHPELGHDLARSSMTICEGRRGWDDYLLLSHFDPDAALDRIETLRG